LLQTKEYSALDPEDTHHFMLSTVFIALAPGHIALSVFLLQNIKTSAAAAVLRL